MTKTHTFPVVKAEVDSIVDDHEGSFGVTLGIITGLPVAYQRNHVLFEEILYFRYRCGVLEDSKVRTLEFEYGGQKNKYLHSTAILAPILKLKATEGQPTKDNTQMRECQRIVTVIVSLCDPGSCLEWNFSG